MATTISQMLQQMQQPQLNPMQQQALNALTGYSPLSIDGFGSQFGFDYSRGYAERQGQAIQNAKQSGYNNQLRQIESGVHNAVNNLDHNYFQNALKQQQSQVNSGLNSGIAADQDLRLAMNRQNAMGNIYSNAQNQSAGIQDALAGLDAERLAYVDQLYNDRRQQGYQNTMNYNQLQQQNAGAYADLLRNMINDNRGYAIQQGELMGNYVPHEAQPLIQTILTAKSQWQGASPEDRIALNQAANNARIQLASMGVNIDRLGESASLNDAMSAVSGMNLTMTGQQNQMDLANQAAAQTGTFVDPRAQQLMQSLLDIKRTVWDRGNASKAEIDQANKLRSQLSALGYDADKLAGANVSYADALRNAQQLGVQTQASQLQNANIQQNQQRIENERQALQNDFTINSERNQIDWDRNAIERELNANNYSLGQLELDLRNAQNIIDAEKLNWDKQSYEQKQQSYNNTNAIIAELMQMNKAEAIKSFGDNYENWIQNGVDVVQVMETLGLTGLLRNEETSSTGSSGGGDPLGSLSGE